MSHKKNKSKKQSNSNKRNPLFLGLVKEVLTLLGGLAGSILAVYGLVKTLKEDLSGFSWLILVGVVLWIGFIWKLFQTRRTTAYSLLIISILTGVIGFIGWQSQVKVAEEKIIVLVAQFDGPEEEYGLRRKILEDLQQAANGYEDTLIVEGDEIVTSSEYARELGEQVNADLVIWAWYRPTENPNITIHIENLSPSEFEKIQESETYQPQATLADLDEFIIQKQIGSDAGALVSFLAGVLRYKSGDYEAAIERFEQVLQKDSVGTFVNSYDLYSNLGYSHMALDDYSSAIKYYGQAVESDPVNADAYINRGTAYHYSGQQERAIQDLYRAAEIDPQCENAYFNLGVTYAMLGKYDNAVEAYGKALEIDPQDIESFNNRGAVFMEFGEYDLAIQDFSRAIEINPDYWKGYHNRGTVYMILEEYDLAVKDFDRALAITSEAPFIYYYRGSAYKALGLDAEAEADFKKYKEATDSEEPFQMLR
jgi:tetratricopeptide (TPR) repeat protein